MKVDVVIPVYAPEKEFFEIVRRLCRQTVLPCRLVVMNTELEAGDSSRLKERIMKIEGTDKLEVIVKGVAKKDFDHGGTRAAALEYCDSELVLYMTQDAVPKDVKLVERLVESFAGEDVAVAYARQYPKELAKESEKLSRTFNYPEHSFTKTAADIERLGIKTYFCSNACAMYRRSVFAELGAFEKGTRFAEDMLFAFKAINAGKAVAYNSQAGVLHSHNYSYREQFRRNRLMAAAQAEHPEVYKTVSSEKEGMKYVLYATKTLLKKGKIFSVIDFYLESAFKYAGFFCGKHFS